MRLLLLLLLGFFQFSFSQCIKPASVKMLPVLFVATDAPTPTDKEKTDLIRHLRWSQSRYLELLGNRSTFAVADTNPFVYKSKQNTDYYIKNGAADNFASELMEYFGCNRYNCPYIFLVVFMDSVSEFPTGGARPFNGGFNTGGGVVQLSSYLLDKRPNFQSTLQHELGHSFGLPHVDVYGYSMDTNMSFMSYNPKHWTDFFNPSATPGIMIPEDIYGLALNDLVFPNLVFDYQKDIPAGYAFAGIIALGIEEIPNQPNLSVSTTAGSQYGTNIKNTLFHIPTAKQDGNTLRVDLCWLSEVLPNGWVEIVYDFPVNVSLDGVFLHSGFGTDPFYHDADSIEIYNGSSTQRIAAQNTSKVDTYVPFTEIHTSKLRVRLRARNGSSICLRGIGFFDKGDDLFPAYVPYLSRDPDLKLYPDVVHCLLPVNDARNLDHSKLSMTWKSSTASKKYLLQIDSTEYFCNPTDTETTDTTITLGNLHQEKSYYWRVRGRNDYNYGAGQWSEIRTFTTDKITVKNNSPARNTINCGSGTLSLTQFSDHITFAIDATTQANTSLRVYNLQGRCVAMLLDGLLNQGRHHFTWNSSLGGTGPYIARLLIGNEHAERLFINSSGCRYQVDRE
jgi:hypothetical protein